VFTVIPLPTPALTLDKPEGLRGSTLTASGTGFTCDNDRVALLWDSQAPVGDAPPGTFSVTLAVPADASISQHTVVAACRDHPDITDSATFMVTGQTAGGVSPASLALAPTRGGPGDAVQVTGERFACNDSGAVQLSWDGQPLKSTQADGSGHFVTAISVPSDAQTSTHIVRAACTTGSAVATAGFTVVVAGSGTQTFPKTPPPPLPSPPPNTSAVGVICLALVILGVAAVLAYRQWRKYQLNPARVHATVTPANGIPLISTSDTPAHGEVSHAIRVLLHADLSSPTINEVDSEYTTQ
jgi:hypothetical protein